MTIDIRDLSENEVSKLAAKGEELFCPRCGAKLEVISDNSGETPRPHSITCPVNSAHFDILYDDADKLRAIRKRMREIAAATDAKINKI
jgi:hypothetical protein